MYPKVADSLTAFSDSPTKGIVTLCKLLQPLNAPTPIVVIVSGTTIEVILVQLAKPSLLISVMGVPLYSEGSTIFAGKRFFAPVAT